MYTKKEYKTTKQEQEEIFYKYFKKISPEVLQNFNGKKLLQVIKGYKGMICSLYFENDMSIHITINGEISIIVDNSTMVFREKHGDCLIFNINFADGSEVVVAHNNPENYFSGYHSGCNVVDSIGIVFYTPLYINSK